MKYVRAEKAPRSIRWRSSLLFLALLGGLAARAGAAGVALGAIRVTFWGALAMAATAGVGALFGTAVH